MEKLHKTTNHAKNRIKERVNHSDRTAELALERGVSWKQYSGSFRRYLDKVIYYTDYYTEALVYNNHIFIYAVDTTEKRLITVLNIPSKYLKYVKLK